MKKANSAEIKGNEKINKISNVCILLFLILYPMRHVTWGLDLWDTGYNYANFRYMGTEHMDSMWLFSTYLSNVVGYFMTVLPFGNTLIGMNVYTGLILSITACVAYLFCTKRLGIPKWLAFVGEVIAISLCWCPTALLYNYLTYLFYTICIVCLYKGLTEGKKGMLFAAGACLGCNLFVRVSNLPEASLILAVWLYAKLVSAPKSIQGSKASIKGTTKGTTKGVDGGKASDNDAGFFRIAVGYTGWCLGGYLTVVGVFLLVISIRYGIGNYMEGLSRLFAMTDTATDYKATSMLMGIVRTYWDMIYWVIRILFFAVIGFVVDLVLRLFVKRKQDKSFLLIGIIAAEAGVIWLLNHDFTSAQYRSYDPIFLVSILFLLYSMAVGAWLVIRPGGQKEERLMGAFVCLVVFFTSVGSNNQVFPSMNNLFWIAPYILWQSAKFVKYKEADLLELFDNIMGMLGKSGRSKRKKTKGRKGQRKKGKGKNQQEIPGFSLVSFKAVLITMLGLFGVQAFLFGVFFSFAEATGMQEGTMTVKGNSVLNGVKMPEDRARWMQEISDFVAERHLEGQEVILYGWVPSLSFYLQMPSAFNPWSDLDSYSLTAMEKDMQELRDSGRKPVVIMGIDQNNLIEEIVINDTLDETDQLVDDSDTFVDDSGESTEEIAEGEQKIRGLQLGYGNNDPKWQMIKDFMEDNGYCVVFRNQRFILWMSTNP